MLRDGGQAHYAYLGVSSVPLYPQLVDHFDLGVDKGAWVQEVNPGGPAAAGRHPRRRRRSSRSRPSRSRRGGDVITKVGGQAGHRTPTTSRTSIARFKPGETVTLEVHRGGDTREIQVKLGERPLGRRPPTAEVSTLACSKPVALAHKSLADYTHIVGRALVEEIRELAEPLKGRRVVHLSARPRSAAACRRSSTRSSR